MRLWLDCEYNDFMGELISLALVDEVGREFYMSLGCENPSPWVARNVMPVLNKNPVHAHVLGSFMARFLSVYPSIHIIADWPEDIAHFCRALIYDPGERFNTPPMTMEVKRDIESISLIPHNALADARAIRLADLMQTQ